MPKSFKGILYAIICAVLWGVLAIVLKVSLKGLSPFDITWSRFFIAFISLSSYYFIKKPYYFRILKRPPILLIIATICLAVNYYGFIEGVNLTTPTVAQVFIQIGPVLLAVSGFIFFNEKLNKRQIFGLFLVIVGLFIFYEEQFNLISLQKDKWQVGVIWVLIAAITWAIYSVLLKLMVLKYPPMQLNLVIFGLPVLLYLPFVNFGDFVGIGLIGWSIILFLGLNTLFAYGLLSLAIQYTEANKISVILVLNPLLTFAIMSILGKIGVEWIDPENYTLLTIAGALIVLIGAVLTIFRKKIRTKIVKTND